MAALAPPQPKTGPGAARRTPVRAGPGSNPVASALQAKLEVGPARDRYEQEADRIADRVMRSPVPEAGSAPPPTVSPLVVQRQAETDKQEEELQRETDKPEAGVETFEVPEEARESFAFVPGQYLTLRRMLGEEDLRRTYSICSGAADPDLRRRLGEGARNFALGFTWEKAADETLAHISDILEGRA